jgi:PPOX class probable F420-dependent enzyme
VTAPRDAVRMTEEEVRAFLHGRHTMSLATLGPDGRPHLVAVWYGFIGEDIGFFSYRRSQKTRNLQRDPRLTCMVECGRTYDELRGVSLAGRAELVEDEEDRVALGLSTTERYEGELTDEGRARVRASIGKRLAVRVRIDRVTSWDHRKLSAG